MRFLLLIIVFLISYHSHADTYICVGIDSDPTTVAVTDQLKSIGTVGYYVIKIVEDKGVVALGMENSQGAKIFAYANQGKVGLSFMKGEESIFINCSATE